MSACLIVLLIGFGTGARLVTVSVVIDVNGAVCDPRPQRSHVLQPGAGPSSPATATSSGKFCSLESSPLSILSAFSIKQNYTLFGEVGTSNF